MSWTAQTISSQTLLATGHAEKAGNVPSDPSKPETKEEVVAMAQSAQRPPAVQAASPSGPHSSSPFVTGVPAVLCALAIGFVFGFAMDKAKVTVPSVLREQMVFRSEVMMKMFLAATAVGMAAVALMERLGLAARTSKGPRALGFGLMRGYGANIVGGFLLGIGITITGSCPGTVFAQLGTGYWKGLLVLLGGWIAAIVYGYSHRLIKSLVPRFDNVGPLLTVDKAIKRAHSEVALVFVAVLIAVLAVLEVAFPWESDLRAAVTFPAGTSLTPFGDPTAAAWSAIGAGALLGFMQVPSFLLFKTALGTSSSYVTCAAYACSVFDRKQDQRAPYLKAFRGSAALMQVYLVCGVVLGAVVSYTSAGVVAVIPASAAPTEVESFFGGMLLLFGARLASGCTSGHGISGTAQLSVPSMVTTAAMFAGAIATGFAFYR